MRTSLVTLIALCGALVHGEKCENQCLEQCKARSRFIYENRKPFWPSDVGLRPRLGGNDESCEHSICESHENYPEKRIEAALEGNEILRSYFGTITEPSDVPDIFSRLKDNHENMCEVKRYTKFPKNMTDVDHFSQTIVNTDMYKQAVSYEYCQGTKCYCEDCNMPTGYETKCMQKYLKIRLLTYGNGTHVDKGKFVYRTFTVPSGCACMYAP